MRRTWMALAACLTLVLAGGTSAAASVTAPAGQAASAVQQLAAGDGPPGFWWGTDSATVPVPGPAPYSMPHLGGAYGGYIGMTGNWANLAGCHKIVVWSATNSAQANTNYLTYHKGIGTGVYWFMGGPGVDPHYTGTTAEASAWGQQQAARTLYDISHVHVTYPVVFMDVEIPGNAANYTPAPDNGWNTVYTSACSGRVKQYHIPASVDRAVFNGFANYITYHKGIGTGVYWFMGGPGVDPHYNGTTSEAYAWGQRQAARTLYDISHVHVTYPVVFMDVEIPGNAPYYTPAPDNGWNTVYTSACSGVVKQYHIKTAVDRADINGFAAYITAHSSYKVGVYSAPSVWTSIFGTGSDSLIPNTYEWTYWPETSSLSNAPQGWRLKSGQYAQFFGGQTYNSKYALMWQWSGGGGIRNGVGDFDQIDANRQG